MPQQLSNPNTKLACFARRLALSTSLSLVACASTAFAQNPTKPAPVASKPAAQVKAGDAQQQAKPRETQPKPATPTSEATRSRRAVAPEASPMTSTVAPPAAVAPSAVAPTVTPKSEAAKATSVDAELDSLRAEIKDAKVSAERNRLQRALVDRLLELKRNDDALSELRLMIHEDRFDPPFFFNTGNALARLGDASAAEDAYRKAISQRRGNYARALNNLGVILIRQGHWDEARDAFAAALTQENYTYAEASYNLGRLHLLNGEADLAIREWSRTLRLEPSHAEAAAALARTYAEEGNAKRALVLLDSFTARATRAGESTPREITEARREIVEASGADAKAGDDKDAGANGANNNGTSGNASPDRMTRGDASHAATSLSPVRAASVDPLTYDLLQKARDARERGSFEDAAKLYRRALAREPGGYFPPANLELGVALLNLKRDEEALKFLLPLTERDATRYPVVYYHLARHYEQEGQLERAAQNYARAAELYGDTNPQLLVDLSRVREKSSDDAGALAAIRSYVKLIERQGTVPAWATEREAKLSKKVATDSTTRGSTAKP